MNLISAAVTFTGGTLLSKEKCCLFLVSNFQLLPVSYYCNRITWAPALICCKIVVNWRAIAGIFYNIYVKEGEETAKRS